MSVAVTGRRARRVLAAGVLAAATLLGAVGAGHRDALPAAYAAEPATTAPGPPVTSAMRLSAPVPIEIPPPAPVLRTGLAAAAVAAAEAAVGGSTELAVAVLDRATGETAVGARGAEPYFTASLSKVVLAVDVLDRRRLEGLVVTDGDLDLIRRALGPSDDAAMSALWSRFDGDGAAARVAARLGLTATTDPDDPSQWGEMSVSAADTVAVWAYVLDGMPAADRDLLIGDLAAAPAVARDGFDQAFGLLSPDLGETPGAVAKQGWMCCFSGIYYMHSAGVVGEDQRFVVALLDRVPRGPGWEGARQELDRVAAAAVAPLL